MDSLPGELQEKPLIVYGLTEFPWECILFFCLFLMKIPYLYPSSTECGVQEKAEQNCKHCPPAVAPRDAHP